MKITTKQFQILTDINLIWDFMVDIYDEKKGGVAAPFFEYAIISSWMDSTYQHLNRIWFDGDKVVGFVFNEAPVTDVYFKIRPGYEFLAKEMVDYAISNMPNFDNNQHFQLFNGQEFIMDIVKQKGYELLYDWTDRHFDFHNELNYELPLGYHFVNPMEANPVKLAKCCWYGFNHHEDKGEFVDWELEDKSFNWTPQKAYKGMLRSFLAPGPHSTREYDIIVANENEEYVCYSGMWWVKENQLAYMEPLCTVPEHRHKGIAAAALAEHYRRLKPQGATHMTGGGDPFYEKIGYATGPHWYCFGKR